MQGASVFRRAFHLASPVFLGYYLVPDVLAPDVSKANVTLLFLGTAWCIEIVRIALSLQMFGMRAYEGRRVSAYAQGSVGLAIGLFLVADPRIVVPAFVGMAWIDPLAAWARSRGWPRISAGAAYFTVFLSIELLMDAFAPLHAVAYAAIATAGAVLVEGPRFKQLDDDLLMQVVPYAAVYALVATFGRG
ncbi:MAG: hypothetical protein ACT4OI_07050 [Methanobacteriota archaeon]